jgi:uncharacterized membrane protein YfcA
MTPILLAELCAFSFLAGFVDSIVGGGALIQVPALLILLPGVSIPTILGTNKLASFAGTSVAASQYSRRSLIPWHIVGPAAATAFVFSFIGSMTVTHVNPAFMRPFILVLLIATATYVFFIKDAGLVHRPKHAPGGGFIPGIITGAALGFYDGFFGPGTGSFLIFIFIGIFGFDFLFASASSKVVNCGTNLASILYFSSTGHILYGTALPMAAFNILGSISGSRLAILKGSGFVRKLFLVVIAALIGKLTYDLLRK